MKNLLFHLFLFLSFSTFSQGLKTDGKKIVNAQGDEVILRGIGPGGWQVMEGYMMNTSGVAGAQHEIRENLIDLMGLQKTDSFFAEWRRLHFTQRDVDSMASWGFNSIRIPMHYNLFTLPIEDEPIPGENTWINTGFELIDSVLDWCAPHDMYVILDLHAAPGGQGTSSEINDYDPNKPSLWESQANKDKTVALWTRIADRYKNDPWIGGYDLINEPHWDLPGGSALRSLYRNITQGIRSVDTTHILFIEGNWYANDFTGLTPPWDPEIVYSFHKYWSFNNEDDLDWVLPLREENNVPLWMGEAGENSNTWFTDAVKLFENNGIGWAWWTIRKIGDIDSPYATDINPGYQKILDYWNGNGPRPSAQETFDGMMQLAQNLLVDNSRYRKDVPDALIRQVQTDDIIPYSNHEIPGIVYLSDFDLGQNHFAYYDKVVADYNLSTGNFQAWNSGWSYRNDGVDIQTNEDTINSNGFHIGFTEKGEWINYTVNITESGVYRADVRLASDLSDAEFHLSIDDQSVSKVQLANRTGGWFDFETHSINDILLEEGEHHLKIHFDNSSVNVSSIEFTKTGQQQLLDFEALTAKMAENEKSIELNVNLKTNESSVLNTKDMFSVLVNGETADINQVVRSIAGERTIILSLENSVLHTDQVSISYNGSQIKSLSDKTLNAFTNLEVINNLAQRFLIPSRIQAEDFNLQSGLQTEDCEDTGGGLNIGYTDAGDYADYNVFVRDSGTYSIKLRVAAESRAGRVGFFLMDESGSEDELARITLPVTGGWQTWESVEDEIVVPSGVYTLRMRVLSPGFNMNWFETKKIEIEPVDTFPPTDTTTIVLDFAYPNPTNRFITVSNEKYDSYSIIGSNGSRIMEGKIPENGQLDLAELKSGVYILDLRNKTTGARSKNNLVIYK